MMNEEIIKDPKLIRVAIQVIQDVMEKKSKKFLRTGGLCINFDCEMYITHDLDESELNMYISEEEIEAWKYYSGCLAYPVNCPNTGISSVDMYEYAYNLWDYRTSYGKMRKKFCEYCITVLENRLSSIENKVKEGA